MLVIILKLRIFTSLFFFVYYGLVRKAKYDVEVSFLRKKQNVHKTKLKNRLIIGFCIFIISIIILDHQLRPLIKSIASNRAQIISTNVINETVLEEISRLDIDYSKIMTLEKDSNGKILAINADMKKISIQCCKFSYQLNSWKPHCYWVYSVYMVLSF